jgi:hypothetical protein
MGLISFVRNARSTHRCRPGWRWWAASLGLVTASALAAPVVGPIDDNDTVRIDVSGDRATVQLTLARAPASSEGATLRVSNRDNFAMWSAPLTRQGNRWTAPLDREGLQALLMVDRMVAEFPGAARDNEALHLVVTRERFLPALEGTAPLLGNTPLFFNAPQPPERPEVPAPTVERYRAESFAMVARLWDHQIAAHQHEFAAARSRALSLFLDLRTAGRLPYPEPALQNLAQGYEALSQREQAIARMRQEWRAAAQNFVRQWNAQHSGEPPLTMNFAEPA